MRIIGIGLLLGIGFNIGKDIYKSIDLILDKIFYEKYQWYRDGKDWMSK